MKRTDIIVAYATTQRAIFEAAYTALDRDNFEAYLAHTDNALTVWHAFKDLYQYDFNWYDTLDAIDTAIRCRVSEKHGLGDRERAIDAYRTRKYRINF